MWHSGALYLGVVATLLSNAVDKAVARGKQQSLTDRCMCNSLSHLASDSQVFLFGLMELMACTKIGLIQLSKLHLASHQVL